MWADKILIRGMSTLLVLMILLYMHIFIQKVTDQMTGIVFEPADVISNLSSLVTHI